MSGLAGAQLWDLNPDALVATDADGCVLHWNKAASTLFGYEGAEVLGRKLTDLIVPAGLLDETRQIEERARESGTVVYETVRRRQDGASVHVCVSVRAWQYDDGATAGFIRTLKDVTEIKVRRDTQMVQARFMRLLESTPDAMVLVDITGRMVLVNRQTEALFGYRREQLLGQPVEVLLPARFRSAHLSDRAGFLTQPRTRTMGAGIDLWGLRQDGSEFPVEVSLSPLETEEGMFVASAIRDVTDRKRTEQDLRDINAQLRQAALVKDRFFAGMSHELRTPLNAILGFTGTLLMKLPGPINTEQERQLNLVRNSARHLLSLINDLLDLAKLNADKLELKAEEVDCGVLAEEVAATLRPGAEAKGLVFTLSLPRQPVVLRTDRRALSQILINLLGNAIKFTDVGGVGLRLEPMGSAGAQGVRLHVEDSGPGIAPDDQARVFEAFTRMDAASRREREGAGLGLHLSKRLAQQMGGSLTFRTETGVGSVFTLHLPSMNLLSTSD